MQCVRMLYPEGKKKALTLSYDDGNVADRKLVALFNKYQLKGTFHLNSGRILKRGENVVKPEEIRELYAGHEVSIHTLTHPYPDRVQRDVMLYEVIKDRENLEKFCGYAVRGMSYPMGSWNKETLEVLKGTGIVYSRTTVPTNNFKLPEDWLLWHPTAHHSHHILDLADRFLDMKRGQLDLFYVWGHSYEFDLNPENPLNNWKMMEEFCEKVSHDPDVWYATNIEIYDYITAQRNLYFTLDLTQVTNPSALDVWLTVNDEIVKVPGGKTVVLPQE